MGVKHLVGTPWQVERQHRAEGDERRHRHRCKYFVADDGHCSYTCIQCGGSVHCKYYTEQRREIEEDKKSEYKPPNVRVGDKVKHIYFGEGTVVSVNSETKKMDVDFNSQSKQFVIGGNDCAFKNGFLKLL